MSSRVEKGSMTFKPVAPAGVARRKPIVPGSSSATQPFKPPARISRPGAASSPPPAQVSKASRQPSASPRLSASGSQGPTRSYAIPASPRLGAASPAAASSSSFVPPSTPSRPGRSSTTPRPASVRAPSVVSESGLVTDDELVHISSESPRRMLPPAIGASSSAFAPKRPPSKSQSRQQDTSAAPPSRQVVPGSAAPSTDTARAEAGPSSRPLSTTSSQPEQHRRDSDTRGNTDSNTEDIAALLQQFSQAAEESAPRTLPPAQDDSETVTNGKANQKGKGRARDPQSGGTGVLPGNEDASGQSGPVKKKQRRTPKVKLAGFPRRPKSAYFFYLAERRTQMKDSDPTASVAEVAKRAGQEWRGLKDDQKRPYEDDAVGAKAQYERDVATWKEQHPDWVDSVPAGGDAVVAIEMSAASRRALTAPHRPKRPLSAFHFFAQDRKAQDTNGQSEAEGKRHAGDEWRDLPLEQRQIFLEKADAAQKDNEKALQTWREEWPQEASAWDAQCELDAEGGKGPNAKKKTQTSVSDDEREYLTLVAEHGQQLLDLRFDPRQTNMSDLAASELSEGRAGKRTFEAEKIRRKLQDDAAAVRRKERSLRLQQQRAVKDRLRRHREGETIQLPYIPPASFEVPSDQTDNEAQASAPSSAPLAKSSDRFIVPGFDSDEEEIDGGEGSSLASRLRSRQVKEGSQSREVEDVDEEDDDARSEGGESAKSFASTGTQLTLRDNLQAPQLRMVDGRMVVDESTLQITRSQAQDYTDQDTIEESAAHKFVNSSSSSKREKPIRWTKDETDEFYKAISMWGSDFEMIARMFTGRSRKQIKAKWNREERSNPLRLDMAFKKKVPVDLEDYAIMANVDLSGTGPKMDEEEALLAQAVVKKNESEANGDDDIPMGGRSVEDAQPGETTADGTEIVEESDHHNAPTRPTKGARGKRRPSVSTSGPSTSSSSSAAAQKGKKTPSTASSKGNTTTNSSKTSGASSGTQSQKQGKGRSTTSAQRQAEEMSYGNPDEEEVVGLLEG